MWQVWEQAVIDHHRWAMTQETLTHISASCATLLQHLQWVAGPGDVTASLPLDLRDHWNQTLHVCFELPPLVTPSLYMPTPAINLPYALMDMPAMRCQIAHEQ